MATRESLQGVQQVFEPLAKLRKRKAVDLEDIVQKLLPVRHYPCATAASPLSISCQLDLSWTSRESLGHWGTWSLQYLGRL